MINRVWPWRRWAVDASAHGTAHIPLGTFCHIAAALRRCGLRQWSGPFDWIFSTPAMIAACLDDDFATLLDPAELRSVPAAELTGGARRQCRHLAYEARFGLPTVFNHHDPVTMPADLRRLRRAVERFRAALHGAAPLRFYVMSEREWPEAEIDTLLAALRRRARRAELVVVTVVPEAPERRRTTRLTAGGLPEIHLQTVTRSLGAAFPDPEDEALLEAALLADARPRSATAAGPSYSGDLERP